MSPFKHGFLRSLRGSASPALFLLLGLCCALLLASCTPNAGILSGGNWQPDGLRQQHLTTLAVQAGSPTTLYAGSAQGTLFVSTDSGQHWIEHSAGLPSAASVYKIATSLNGQEVYVATAQGLFKSSSNALNWVPVTALPSDQYRSLDFSVHDLHTLYVGSAHHGVLVSHNDGNSWAQAGNGLPSGEPVNNLVVDTDNGHIWCAVSGGVYRLDNRQTIWQHLQNGLPSGLIVNTVLPASLVGGSANLVYLGTNRGFFLSQDDGAHWERGQVSLSGTSVHAIRIDTNVSDGRTLYLATDAGALRSIDGGQEWGLVAKGIPSGQPVSALVQGAENNTQLYALADQVYIYPGTSGGITPEHVLPLILFAAFFVLLILLVRRGRRRRPPARREVPVESA